MKITVNLDISPEKVIIARRNLQPYGKAQVFVDSEVLRCSDKYIPKYTGMLIESGENSTVKGSGIVHWNTPYARKNYYENAGRGTDGIQKGGLRGRLWFERMKKDYLPTILKGVKKISGAK